MYICTLHQEILERGFQMALEKRVFQRIICLFMSKFCGKFRIFQTKGVSNPKFPLVISTVFAYGRTLKYDYQSVIITINLYMYQMTTCTMYNNLLQQYALWWYNIYNMYIHTCYDMALRCSLPPDQMQTALIFFAQRED